MCPLTTPAHGCKSEGNCGRPENRSGPYLSASPHKTLSQRRQLQEPTEQSPRRGGTGQVLLLWGTAAARSYLSDPFTHQIRPWHAPTAPYLMHTYAETHTTHTHTLHSHTHQSQVSLLSQCIHIHNTVISHTYHIHSYHTVTSHRYHIHSHQSPHTHTTFTPVTSHTYHMHSYHSHLTHTPVSLLLIAHTQHIVTSFTLTHTSLLTHNHTIHSHHTHNT